MTISAGGASDEAICRLAKGKLMGEGCFEAVKPIAFTMALPAIFATYSSISLLAGLVTMVLSGPGEGVLHKGSQYIKATMIPVGGGFVCLCVALFFCEIGTWIEMRGRAKYRASYDLPPRTTPTPPGESQDAQEPKLPPTFPVPTLPLNEQPYGSNLGSS
ncbi:hypothetical protein FRC06_010025 [Ceratobasidium sp. 370]|nr:hypothetical protein FRC06_010025 [Ceratobasidium sp. 370]